MLGLANRNHGVENDYRGEGRERREGEERGEDGEEKRERMDDGRERSLKVATGCISAMHSVSSNG